MQPQQHRPLFVAGCKCVIHLLTILAASSMHSMCSHTSHAPDVQAPASRPVLSHSVYHVSPAAKGGKGSKGKGSGEDEAGASDGEGGESGSGAEGSDGEGGEQPPEEVTDPLVLAALEKLRKRWVWFCGTSLTSYPGHDSTTPQGLVGLVESSVKYEMLWTGCDACVVNIAGLLCH